MRMNVGETRMNLTSSVMLYQNGLRDTLIVSTNNLGKLEIFYVSEQLLIYKLGRAG